MNATREIYEMWKEGNDWKVKLPGGILSFRRKYRAEAFRAVGLDPNAKVSWDDRGRPVVG